MCNNCARAASISVEWMNERTNDRTDPCAELENLFAEKHTHTYFPSLLTFENDRHSEYFKICSDVQMFTVLHFRFTFHFISLSFALCYLNYILLAVQPYSICWSTERVESFKRISTCNHAKWCRIDDARVHIISNIEMSTYWIFRLIANKSIANDNIDNASNNPNNTVRNFFSPSLGIMKCQIHYQKNMQSGHMQVGDKEFISPCFGAEEKSELRNIDFVIRNPCRMLFLPFYQYCSFMTVW